MYPRNEEKHASKVQTIFILYIKKMIASEEFLATSLNMKVDKPLYARVYVCEQNYNNQKFYEKRASFGKEFRFRGWDYNVALEGKENN